MAHSPMIENAHSYPQPRGTGPSSIARETGRCSVLEPIINHVRLPYGFGAKSRCRAFDEHRSYGCNTMISWMLSSASALATRQLHILHQGFLFPCHVLGRSS